MKVKRNIMLAIDARRNKGCTDCIHGYVCIYGIQEGWVEDCKLYRFDWKKWLRILFSRH